LAAPYERRKKRTEDRQQMMLRRPAGREVEEIPDTSRGTL